MKHTSLSSAFTIAMFPRDQLFCDKGKLRCNESSFVGHILQTIPTYLFAIKNTLFLDRVYIQSTKYLFWRKLVAKQLVSWKNSYHKCAFLVRSKNKRNFAKKSTKKYPKCIFAFNFLKCRQSIFSGKVPARPRFSGELSLHYKSSRPTTLKDLAG